MGDLQPRVLLFDPLFVAPRIGKMDVYQVIYIPAFMVFLYFLGQWCLKSEKIVKNSLVDDSVCHKHLPFITS